MIRTRTTGAAYVLAATVLTVSAAVLGPLLCPQSAPAQGLRFDLSGDITLDEVDAVTKGHLQRAAVLTKNRRWDEVIDTLRQVTDSRGDRVIAVAPGYYVRLKDYCHRRLAALPPEALKIYREQVDPQAEQWFNEAVAGRDERKLRRIVDQFYCSSRGDDALRLLGEAALTRGDLGAARGYWEQLLEAPPAVVGPLEFADVKNDPTLTAAEHALLDKYYLRREPSGTFVLRVARSIDPDMPQLSNILRTRGVVGPRLAYPQAELAAADVVARLILVSILEGSREWAAAGIRELQEIYPSATGRLGGRDVNYVEALTQLIEESKSWPAAARGNEWLTFAGNAERNKTQPVDADFGRVRWRVSWNPVAAGEYDYPARRVAEDSKTLLSYHPVVADGRVFFADGGEVRAYELATGLPAWGGDPVIFRPGNVQLERPFTQAATIGAPRFTLTVHGRRLFARMGRATTGALIDGSSRTQENNIVCLDLAAEGKLLWSKTPPGEDRWSFEGTPLADDDFVYVALRKGGVRPQAHVECRDAETGEVVWRRMICSAETPAQGQVDEITNNLLTLNGDAIYYNTNLGAVAALSKADGEIRWITTYPRASGQDLNRRSAHFFRDLTPCVYDRGTLYVAPADSRHILALDAAAGLLRWETTLADDVVHLLGTAGDHLLASGDKLWWIQAHSGRIAHVWPDESPKGYGRGAIVGDVVLRPTRTTIEVFGAADGLPRREIELSTRDASGGHLIAVDDSLLIAGGEELIVLDRHGGPRKPVVPKPESSGDAAVPNTKINFNLNPRVDE